MNFLNLKFAACFCILLTVSTSFAETSAPTKSSEVEKPPQAKILNAGSCPFRRDSSSVDNLVKQAKSALQNLADQESKCPATKRIAEQLEKNLNAVLEYNKINNENRQTMDSGDLNCENYQSALKSEFEFVMNQNMLKNTPWIQSNISRYGSCGDSNSSKQTFEECASKVYFASLEKETVKCDRYQAYKKTTGREQFSQDVMKELAANAKILLENSKQCQGDSSTSKFVIQSVLGAVSSLGYLATGPLTGAAVALTGDLLSSFVQRFFSDKSPSALIGYIDAEYEFEELNCLYYELQNRSLSCNNLISASVKPGCTLDNRFFHLIGSISQIENALDKNQTDSFMIPELRTMHFIFTDKENFRTADPMSGATQSLNFIKQININQFPVESFQSISKEVDAVLSDQSATQEKKDKALLAYLKPIQESSRAVAAGEASLSQKLKESGNAYWNAAGRNQEYENNIKALSNWQFIRNSPVFNAVNEKTIKELVDSSGAQNKLDIAHSAFLNGYKSKFEKRLTSLYERYQKNVTYQSREDSALDMIPLLQMCTLNSSMYYFESTDMTQKARNNVSSRPDSTYREACEMFKCQIPFFDPNQFQKEQRPQAFRHYQCSLNFKYSEAIDKLMANMKTTGKPCP